MGTSNLLLLSALLLGRAVAAALALRRLFAGPAGSGEEQPIGKGLLAGAVAVWQSPYLFRIALWILLANLVGTLFYLEQAASSARRSPTAPSASGCLPASTCW